MEAIVVVGKKKSVMLPLGAESRYAREHVPTSRNHHDSSGDETDYGRGCAAQRCRTRAISANES